MTHPLTPREKVADDLKLVIAHAIVEELRAQHPDVDQIDNERGGLWLPGGSTPQSAGCVIDLHAIAASVEREMGDFLKASYKAGWNDREGDFLFGCDRVLGPASLASSGDHAELARLAEAATPGPWEWWSSCSHWRLTGADRRDGGVISATKASDGFPLVVCNEDDRAFIAAARSAVPALIAEVAALRETNTEAERKLAEAVGLLRKFHDAWRSGCGWLPTMNALDDEISEFVSKEAERG